MTQMDNRAKLVEEMLKSIDTGGVEATSLAQVIEDSLHPHLKDHIAELHYHHARPNPKIDFMRDTHLHRLIVKFFEEMKYGSFSMSDLDIFAGFYSRFLNQEELRTKKSYESEKSRLLKIVTDHLSQTRPLINSGRAEEHLKKERKYELVPSSVYERDVSDIVSVDVRNSEPEVYKNYFAALVVKDQLQKDLTVATRERQDLQSSFKLLTIDEAKILERFARNQDPTYSSVVYGVKYCEWRLSKLKQGVITINIVHRFE